MSGRTAAAFITLDFRIISILRASGSLRRYFHTLVPSSTLRFCVPSLLPDCLAKSRLCGSLLYDASWAFAAQANPKRRVLYALLCGGVTAASMPPVTSMAAGLLGYGAFFLMFISGAKTLKRAFWDGCAFGFGYFLVGLYWITFALSVDWAQFFWLAPFALFGIPAILCLYHGLASALAVRWTLSPVLRLPAFACALWFTEFLRSELWTGFPWNIPGYMLSDKPYLMQLASLGGVHLLGAAALFWALTPVAYILYAAGPLRGRRVALIWCCAAPVTLAGAWGYGAYRTSVYETFARTAPAGPVVRVVQTAFPQALNETTEDRMAHLRRVIELSKIGEGSPALTVWPESGFPFVMADDAPPPVILREAVPASGALAFGSMGGKTDPLTGEWTEVRNALFVLDSGPDLRSYTKSHLVPFGEYVPFRRFLPFMTKITEGMTDFTEGPGPQTLRATGFVPFSPQICYEGVFPGEGVNREDPPQAIVNVTNDAWYGVSSGPYQHYAMAMMRAAEEGVPVIRANNEGLSGVADALGRTVVQTTFGEEGAVQAALPPTFPGGTPYAAWRAWVSRCKRALISEDDRKNSTKVEADER